MFSTYQGLGNLKRLLERTWSGADVNFNLPNDVRSCIKTNSVPARKTDKSRETAKIPGGAVLRPLMG